MVYLCEASCIEVLFQQNSVQSPYLSILLQNSAKLARLCVEETHGIEVIFLPNHPYSSLFLCSSKYLRPKIGQTLCAWLSLVGEYAGPQPSDLGKPAGWVTQAPEPETR